MRPKDKRRYPRMKKKLNVSFYKKWLFIFKGQTNAAEVQDVSKGGVRINTGVELSRGEGVSLLVKSKQMRDTLEFGGRVVWVKRLRHEGIPFTQAGIKFQALGGSQSLMVFRLMSG